MFPVRLTTLTWCAPPGCCGVFMKGSHVSITTRQMLICLRERSRQPTAEENVKRGNENQRKRPNSAVTMMSSMITEKTTSLSFITEKQKDLELGLNKEILLWIFKEKTLILQVPGVTYPGAAALTKAPLASAALPLPLATCAATAEAAAAAARAPLVCTQTHSAPFFHLRPKCHETVAGDAQTCIFQHVECVCLERRSLMVHCFRVNAVLLVSGGHGWGRTNVFYLRQDFLLLVCGCVGTGEELFQSR